MNITLTGINLNEQISIFDELIVTKNGYESHFFEALYKYIIESKSINGIEIELPSMEFESSCSKFCTIGEAFKGVGGIYFLSGKDNRLLNIGNTSDLYDRVYKKWVGKNGGSRADYYFGMADYYYNVALFIEEDSIKRKLYEVYLINKFQPPLNKQFNYYDKSVYLETLKKEQDKHKTSNFLGLGYKKYY